MAENEVQLYIYDISKGLARALSPMFLGGKQIDGVWHTGIVAFNEEHFFGSFGISSCPPGGMFIGQPDKIIPLGKTQIPYDVFLEYLHELGETTFRGSKYHLLEHNCNTFSNELANFLTGKSIPEYITNLPKEVMGTPIGALIQQFVGSMSDAQGHSLDGATDWSSISVDGATGPQPNDKATAAADAAVASSTDVRVADVKEEMPPLAVYMDASVVENFKERREMLRGILRPNDYQSVEEVFEYLSLPECDWSLSRNHLVTLCSLVGDLEMSDEVRHITGHLLQFALTRTDFVDVVEHDSNKNVVTLFRKCETFADQLFLTTARCLCNLLASKYGVKLVANEQNNHRLSTEESCTELVFSICTRCLLHEDVDLTDVGCGIAGNVLQQVKVSADSAVKLGVALIEVAINFSAKTFSQQQTVDRLWFSLCKCMNINSEIVDLAKAMGLDIADEEKKHPEITKYTKSVQRPI